MIREYPILVSLSQIHVKHHMKMNTPEISIACQTFLGPVKPTFWYGYIETNPINIKVHVVQASILSKTNTSTELKTKEDEI